MKQLVQLVQLVQLAGWPAARIDLGAVWTDQLTPRIDLRAVWTDQLTPRTETHFSQPHRSGVEPGRGR